MCVAVLHGIECVFCGSTDTLDQCEAGLCHWVSCLSCGDDFDVECLDHA